MAAATSHDWAKCCRTTALDAFNSPPQKKSKIHEKCVVSFETEAGGDGPMTGGAGSASAVAIEEEALGDGQLEG